MKLIIIVAMLSVLMACGKKSTSKKSCSFNGQSVSCGQMQEINPVTGEQIVRASVDVPVIVNEFRGTFTVLESRSARTEGQLFPCSVYINAGEYRYDILSGGSTLQMVTNRRMDSYSRVSAVSGGLIGQWRKIEYRGSDQNLTIFNFIDPRTLIISAECSRR